MFSSVSSYLQTLSRQIPLSSGPPKATREILDLREEKATTAFTGFVFAWAVLTV